MRFHFGGLLSKSAVLLLIVYAGYVSLGLPDTVLGVAWPFMRLDFGSPVSYAGIMTSLVTLFSATASFCSGFILRRIGTGSLLAACGLTTGSALLALSLAPSFPIMLMLAIPLGLGSGAIDAGMNYYVARSLTSRHMSWLHGSWGIGATVGPWLMTWLIGLDQTWRAGYAVIGLIQLSLAVAFLSTLSLWTISGQSKAEESRAPIGTALGRPKMDFRFWTSTLMFFVYCSIEMSIGLWSYQLLTQIYGVADKTAGYYVSSFWGGLMTGRFMLGALVNRIGNRKLIRLSIIGIMACGMLLAWAPAAWVAWMALMMLGLSLASVYPCMMHETPRRFNAATTRMIMGFQSGAGMIGFGIFSSVVGFVAARTTFGILPYLVMGSGMLLFVMQTVVDGWSLTYSPKDVEKCSAG